MVYEVRRAEETETDLDRIEDFLLNAYLDFGNSFEEAFEAVEKRVGGILNFMDELCDMPHRGMLSSDILPGLRVAEKDKAVLYFEIDESSDTIMILGIFFGGQDHQRWMIDRLKSVD